MEDSQRRVVLYVSGVVIAAGLLFAGFGITIPPDPGTRLNGAMILAEVGKLDEALDICRQVLAEHPDNIEARVYAANFLARAKRFDEALVAYGEAIELSDGEMRKNLLQDRAGLLLEAGRAGEFAKECERLAQEDMGHRLHVLAGFAAAKRADWKVAAAAYRKALAMVPEDKQVRARLWNAEMERGRAALAARRFEEAQEAFDACCKLFPTATRAHIRATEVRLARGEPVSALGVLKQVSPKTPGAAGLAFRVATAFIERGNRKDALQALEGAFKADPTGTKTLFDRDPAWNDYRTDAAIVEVVQKFREADLTGKE